MRSTSPSSPAPLCFMCSRYLDSYRCEAFPEGIPFEVIASEVDHREELADDHGLRYVPVTPAAATYAEELFSATGAEPIVSSRGFRRVPA